MVRLASFGNWIQEGDRDNPNDERCASGYHNKAPCKKRDWQADSLISLDSDSEHHLKAEGRHRVLRNSAFKADALMG
jgi:hypothetical protein